MVLVIAQEQVRQEHRMQEVLEEALDIALLIRMQEMVFHGGAGGLSSTSGGSGVRYMEF